MDLADVAADTSTPSALPAGWQHDAVFMEIYVRGYQDSTGDGIGDLDGVTARLDYLADLGIKGIWLMPINASGDHDHGYAVTDHRKIEADYGDEAALKRLLAAAHARGIGVVLDYVMNHGSAASPLFQDALAGAAYKRDWYVWSDTQPDWGMPVNPWRPSSAGYYYAVFDAGMPDFNLRNEAVVNYHLGSMRKWLNAGVDGFRLDAVQAYIENGYHDTNQPETFALLRRVQSNIAQYPSRFMVCEDPPDPRLAADQGCDSAFFFGLHSALVASARDGVVDASLAGYLTDAHLPRMSTFLANHDTFAGDRLFNQLGGDDTRVKLALASLLTLPGTPFIYYGDEIGMSLASKEDGTPANHDHQLRPPMSWTADAATAGFTSGASFRTLADNVVTHNVVSEQADSGSIYAATKQLIALRNAEPALRRGDIAVLSTGSNAVLAFTRSDGTDKLLVAINYAGSPSNASLTLDAGGSGWRQVYPGSSEVLAPDGSGRVTLNLASRSAAVYKLSR